MCKEKIIFEKATSLSLSFGRELPKWGTGWSLSSIPALKASSMSLNVICWVTKRLDFRQTWVQILVLTYRLWASIFSLKNTGNVAQSQNSLGISVLWELRAKPLVSNWWVKEYKHPSIFALIRSTPRCDLSCLRSSPVELSKGYSPWTWPDFVTLASLSSLHCPATLLPILIKHYNRNLCLQVSWRPQSRNLVFIFLAASSLYTHIWAHLPTSAQAHSTQSPLNSTHPTLLLIC